MRRFLGALAMMVTVGAAAVGLWAGVGRAAGPAPVSPLADRAIVLPATATATATATAPDAAAAPGPVAAAEVPVPAAEPASDPTPAPVVAMVAVPVPVLEPVAAAAGEPASIVSCGIGVDGAFVEVGRAADCPGSAAVRIEATTNA